MAPEKKIRCLLTPKKIRDKLCYEGGGSIKSIEIVEQSKVEPTQQESSETETTTVKPDNQPKSGTQATKGILKRTKRVTFKDPIAQIVGAKYLELAPISVLAYPELVQPVGVIYYGGHEGPSTFYGRPIYDSYGGGEPTYFSNHDQNPWEGEDSGCTIV